MNNLQEKELAEPATGMTPQDFNYSELLNCMRCGFCLPTCPTYQETGLEMASPRGRIALIKAAADGRLGLADITPQMDLCLGCRNCEPVCPSGVKYGALLEDARQAVAASKPRGPVRRLFFDVVFPRAGVLKLMGALLWLYQTSGLHWLAHATGLIRLLPRHLWEMDAILPRARAPWRRRHTVPAAAQTTTSTPTAAAAERRPRVGIFLGCVMEILFWETNQATIQALVAAGCKVVLVEGQGCCGALHAHAGEKPGALKLAKRNIRVFGATDVDYIVNNAGGCGAALKEYGHWLHGDPAWEPHARAFAAKVRDFSELLATLAPLDLPGLPDEKVTMQESCHLAHGQGVRLQPRHILRRIPGVTFSELAEPDRCCGSAGIYNVVQPEMSAQVLNRKMAQVKDTGAQTVVTTNPGCLLQMRLGIRRAGLEGQVRAVHIADLLAEAARQHG